MRITASDARLAFPAVSSPAPRSVGGLAPIGPSAAHAGLGGPASNAGGGSSRRWFVAGTVLVGFRAGTGRGSQERIAQSVGAQAVRVIGADTHVLRLARTRVLAAVVALRRHRDVRYAEPDYIAQASAVPNDSAFGLQWGVRNVGQGVPTEGPDERRGTRTNGAAGADDKATFAWNTTTGSPSIVIGEVDTGVDYNHPDLAANVWTNPGGIGGCPAGTHGYNVIAGTCDPMDDDREYGGHGTHVAGILGARGNNSVGVAGMNWETTILPVKWLDSDAYGTTAQLISALDWLVKAKQAGVNIRVVNDSSTFVGTAYSQALSDEIDLLGSNDILFVTSAGNTGQNDDNRSFRRYPCGYDRPTEICATASDLNDRIPSWANHGRTTVDLAAPGASIYSTLPHGRYGYLSGGSMAAAQVAGAAALILSARDMSATALKADILNHVDRIPAMTGLVRTGGRLDVCKAIRGCRQPALTTTAQVLSGQTLPSLLRRGLRTRIQCNAPCSLAAHLLMRVSSRLPGHRTRMNLLGELTKPLRVRRTLQFAIILSPEGRRALLHTRKAALTLQLTAYALSTDASTASALQVSLTR